MCLFFILHGWVPSGQTSHSYNFIKAKAFYKFETHQINEGRLVRTQRLQAMVPDWELTVAKRPDLTSPTPEEEWELCDVIQGQLMLSVTILQRNKCVTPMHRASQIYTMPCVNYISIKTNLKKKKRENVCEST